MDPDSGHDASFVITGGIAGYSDATWPHFYQTRSTWSMDQGSNKNHSPAYNVAPTVTKFCVMWEGLSLPHDTKFGNWRCKIVDCRAFPSWSLIHGLRWSGLIKAEPGVAKLASWQLSVFKVSEWLDLTAFLGTSDIGVHILVSFHGWREWNNMPIDKTIQHQFTQIF